MVDIWNHQGPTMVQYMTTIGGTTTFQPHIMSTNQSTVYPTMMTPIQQHRTLSGLEDVGLQQHQPVGMTTVEDQQKFMYVSSHGSTSTLPSSLSSSMSTLTPVATTTTTATGGYWAYAWPYGYVQVQPATSDVVEDSGYSVESITEMEE